MADITPPVALAAYAGATIAQTDLMQTGNTAFRLGMAKALVPFVFVYAPSMLIVVEGFNGAEFIIATGVPSGVVGLAIATPVLLQQFAGWRRRNAARLVPQPVEAVEPVEPSE